MMSLIPEPYKLPEPKRIKALGMEFVLHECWPEDLLVMRSSVDVVWCDLRTGEIFRPAERRSAE